MAFGLNTFSQESRSKTLTWNDSTGRFVTNGYPSIIGPALKRLRTSPPSGCGPTTMTARIWPWAVSPRSSIWPRLHNRSTFRAGGNRGDYRSRNTNGTEFQGANSAGTAGSIQSKLIEVQPFFFYNQRSLSNLFNGRPNILTNNSKEKQLNTTKKKNSRR